MTNLRLIDLLKLAPLTLAAALLAGCGGATDEAAPPADESIGAEISEPVVEPAEGEAVEEETVEGEAVEEETAAPEAEVTEEPAPTP
ncbi:hypothetical protein [Tautonia sociabilis]|uniref:Uncharacterized protein n=1 Tax=Tautonia sociabilis TaxID=2080755 RepID=A0A432MHH7_9BACT|nr:hypothetical protein [Tautonia sociabilis]RUL86274.1 hypothetical protein TsocGM_16200 [Tautonia sociabilis]